MTKSKVLVGLSLLAGLAVAAIGSRDDLRQIENSLGDGIEKILGPSTGATVWTSFTPFVLPRYAKRNGKNSIIGQVLAELTGHGFPPAQVEIVDPCDPRYLHLRHANRVRRRGGSPPPVDCGYALRLTFTEPVSGPIALGYGSHFGLGLFAAES